MDRLFPLLIVILAVIAAVIYFLHGNIKMGFFYVWTAAINLTVIS